MRFAIVALIAISSLLVGQAPKSEAKITDAQRAKFWRAQAEYLAASMQVQKAKAALDALQTEMAKSCESQQLTASTDGEPMCQLKSETPKPQAP